VQALVSRLFQPVRFDVATSPSSCGEREVCKELTDVLESNSVFSCAFSPASGPPWCVLAPLPVPPPTPSESSNHTVIIVAVACGVVVVVVVVAAVVYVKQKARHRKLSTLPMHEDSECCDEGYVAAPGGTALASKRPVPASAYVRPPCATFSDQLNLYDLESFRLPYDHIVLQKPLAQGAFGDVWLGHLLNQRVAVKTLKVANVAQDVQLFIWEILLLSKYERELQDKYDKLAREHAKLSGAMGETVLAMEWRARYEQAVADKAALEQQVVMAASSSDGSRHVLDVDISGNDVAKLKMEFALYRKRAMQVVDLKDKELQTCRIPGTAGLRRMSSSNSLNGFETSSHAPTTNEYLKNIVIKYMSTDQDEVKEHMEKAIATVLNFSSAEVKHIQDKRKGGAAGGWGLW
ncbi:hypothetical protein DYB25_006036, partial [Aphanomyces astaci]